MAAEREHRKDPTKPANVEYQQINEQESENTQYRLTAIFTKNDQKFGIVNGRVLQVGDEIADMVVTEVSSTTIYLSNLQDTQQTMALELLGAVSVKKRVSK